jgi:hypothetical protein
MRFRKTLTFFMLVMGLVLALSLWAQQKPFTQEQVVSMVRAGLGDDSGAKLIEQRGIDFAPAEDFIQKLKVEGASEAFLKALRVAKPPEPTTAKKRLNQVQVFALIEGSARNPLIYGSICDFVGRKLGLWSPDLCGCARDINCTK